MAVTAAFRQQSGTVKTFKSSPSGGNEAAITLASLGNGSYRQSAKIDLGTPFAQAYDVFIDSEHAATPTAGNTLDLWWSSSLSATAGTDNQGGTSGSDAAYTGYNADAANSVKHLLFIGSMVLAARATSTVQKGYVGTFVPPTRYGSIVLLNGAGSAFHTSDANCQIRFVPKEFTSEPS